MKRICLLFLLLSSSLVLYSQSVWTGNAAVASEKEFTPYFDDIKYPERYFGASNSFPGSTEVTVTNPRNGKSVTVSIVKRLSQPGLFLVLSAEAGSLIGLPEDDIFNVEVMVRRKNEEVFNTYSEEKPFSDDPDLNPSAELAQNDSGSSSETYNRDKALRSEPKLESQNHNEIPPLELSEESELYPKGYDPLIVLEDNSIKSDAEEIIEIVDDPDSMMDTINTTVTDPSVFVPLREEGDVLEPEIFETRPDEKLDTEVFAEEVILADPYGNEDSKPDVVEISDYIEESKADDVYISEYIKDDSTIEEILVLDSDSLPLEPDIELNEEDESADPMIVEELVPHEMNESEGEELIANENIIYFLTPSDFRPPPLSEIKNDKVKEKTKEKSIVAIPIERDELEGMIVNELRNGGSYLQIGVYSSRDVLYSQIKFIDDVYPSIVLTMGDEENKLYKLLIGPISKDEKGIILMRFRSLGYMDAFLYSPK